MLYYTIVYLNIKLLLLLILLHFLNFDSIVIFYDLIVLDMIIFYYIVILHVLCLVLDIR